MQTSFLGYPQVVVSIWVRNDTFLLNYDPTTQKTVFVVTLKRLLTTSVIFHIHISLFTTARHQIFSDRLQLFAIIVRKPRRECSINDNVLTFYSKEDIDTFLSGNRDVNAV